MDPPAAVSVESKPEKSDESKPKSYDCGLCDIEVVYKIAQELLPGLASACVDNTTGGLFKNAGTVAVDMRKDMSDYLLQRSETYVAEFLLSDNAPVEISEHPYDIIITLIDDFTASKRNMFSRVSEWVFSDGREDRIDDFVQEMDINGFWLLTRRESIASILLKNVDYKNSFHCNVVCGSEEEVAQHRSGCKFRPMDCVHEGCTTRYCAAQKENHDAICPFMILQCEQKCSDYVMRREMDRHCVTICPMKLVNCAFYTVGCKSCIPRSNVQQHNADDLSAHLLFIIQTAHKEANEDDLKKRVEKIRSLTNTEKLARARDARALTYLIKDAETELGPLEPKNKPPSGESPDTHDSPSHDDIIKNNPPTETKPLIVKDGSKSPTKTEPMVKDGSDPPIKTDPLIVKDGSDPPKKTDPSIVKDGSNLPIKTDPSIVKDGSDPPIKTDPLIVKGESDPSIVKDGSDPPIKTDTAIVKDGSDPSKKTDPSIVKDGSDPPIKTDPLIVKDGSDPPKKTDPSIVKDGSDPPIKTDASIVKDGSDPPKKTDPSIVKDGSGTPIKTEPMIVKDGSDPPKKNEPSIDKDGIDQPTKKEDRSIPPSSSPSPPANEMKPSTEKPTVEEVHQEPPKPVESTDSVVKTEEKKDKQESSSSPIEKKEETSEPPLKKEVPRDIKEETTKEKEKSSDSNEEERAKSPPKGEKVEESMKPSIEEKNRVQSNNEEEDKKKSPKTETIEESTKSPSQVS